MNRKRIKASKLSIYVTKEEIELAKKKAKGNRLTWWEDCGLTYATISSFGGQITVFSKGSYQGL